MVACLVLQDLAAWLESAVRVDQRDRPVCRATVVTAVMEGMVTQVAREWMQLRPVRQRQVATAVTAELEALAATSPPDKPEMVATADEVVPAAPVAVASRAEQILTARQVVTQALVALVALVDRQLSEQVDAVVTAELVAPADLVDLVLPQVTVERVEMVRMAAMGDAAETQAARTAMVATADEAEPAGPVERVGQQSTQSPPAQVELEVLEDQAEPADLQDPVLALLELPERLESAAAAVQVAKRVLAQW